MLITVLANSAPTGDKGPWWFASAIGIAGILLGLLFKWGTDALQTRNRDRRDDKLRFIQDKRVAYADLLAACTDVADAENDHRLLCATGRRLDDSDSTTDEDIADYNSVRERLVARRTKAYRAVTQSSSIVDLIAPADVVSAADLLLARCHHPHLYQPRVDAERAYVEAVRSDLGYPTTSRLPYITYEPFIEYDDPQSGIEETEWQVGPLS